MTSEAQRVDMINAVCAQYGLPPLDIPPEPESREEDVGEFLAQADHRSITSCAEAALIVSPEIGAPGQRVGFDGIPIDPSGQYGPTRVRGSWGGSGLYEYYLRTSGLVGDAVQTHTETLVSGTWQLKPPTNVSAGMKRKLDRWCAWQNSKLMSVKDGWSRTVEHMASLIAYGFSASELVWALDTRTGWHFIERIAWRYPGTVDAWLMDSRESELLGARFRTGAVRSQMTYVLPAVAPNPWQRKLLLQNIGALGNNWEGIAPMRRVLVLLKLRDLILQIMGVAADVYGVPRAVLRADPQVLARGGKPTQADVRSAWRAMANARAVDAPAMSLPDGLMIEFIGPSGVMPDLLAQLQHIETQILIPFSNEGSLLGINTSGGAYALGMVKERDQLRSAPFYARLIADPLNDIFKGLARSVFGELPDYPHLVWEAPMAEDASTWITDACKLIGGTLETWPRMARDTALQKLGLPPETYDEQDAARAQAALMMPEAPTPALITTPDEDAADYTDEEAPS